MARFKRRPSDPLSSLPPSRHPFQIWTLTACLFAGWVVLLKDPNTQFSRTVPDFVTTMWGLLLIISSSIAIVSAWWPDRVTGLLLERASLYGLASGTLTYGTVLWVVLGSVAAQNGSLTIAVGIAAIWRARHISSEMMILARLVNSRVEG